MVLCLAVTLMLCFPDAVGIQAASKTLGYESRLFDTSYVHSIDIVMDDWDSFVENCESEEYSSCAVVIDGESYKNIAIRAKGNTSLSQVANYGSDRYSFKLEFDHYSDSTTYHGLDKLCLNNIIQDNTYMKDYLCYTMMNYAGVSSPLCSFAFITVNGEDWGLYLAVEAVEDSFLERNYSGTGNLYKPDSMSMGGGRGNGKNFDQDDFDLSKFDKSNTENDTSDSTDTSSKNNFQPPQMGNFGGGKGDKGGFGGMGSDDVKLIYTDDDFDSYENIFNSAKTDITDSDKTRLINSLKVLNSDDAASAVDVDAVIKYFAVHNFVCNFDSYTGSMIHNYYLYENDGILSMIPWDYNLAFGGFVGGSNSTSMINYPIDSPVSGGDTDSRPMLAWIFADEEYTELYHKALSEFIANYFEIGYFGEEIDRVTALISPYVEKGPTKFCTYDEFTAGVSALKEFCTLRAESVRGQLDGTIPSTSDAQSEDSSALISGSSVSISAMGSMNGGGMGGGMQNAVSALLRTEISAISTELRPKCRIPIIRTVRCQALTAILPNLRTAKHRAEMLLSRRQTAKLRAILHRTNRRPNSRRTALPLTLKKPKPPLPNRMNKPPLPRTALTLPNLRAVKLRRQSQAAKPRKMLLPSNSLTKIPILRKLPKAPSKTAAMLSPRPTKTAITVRTDLRCRPTAVRRLRLHHQTQKPLFFSAFPQVL